ncbi:MAG: hypothetical protein K6E53_11695 [Lachnospiraceae bacterium]|nr:hypothetical protein [Lachnospiraceae bacterium]
MISTEYRNKIVKEFADTAILLTDIFNEDEITPDNLLMFKLLTDISKRLEGIEIMLNVMVNNGIEIINK